MKTRLQVYLQYTAIVNPTTASSIETQTKSNYKNLFNVQDVNDTAILTVKKKIEKWNSPKLE